MGQRTKYLFARNVLIRYRCSGTNPNHQRKYSKARSLTQTVLHYGAAVELRNTGTNFVRDVTTDEDGRFAALQLPPGRYTITVSKQGFATLVVERRT